MTQRRRLKRAPPKPPLVANPFEAQLGQTSYLSGHDVFVTPSVHVTMKSEMAPRMITTSTVSPLPPLTVATSGRLKVKQVHAASCTHMTMTRFYTEEDLCLMCEQVGAFGWLYRCTQDRELLIEHEMTQGTIEVFGTLYDALTPPNKAKKRSAEARENPLALLDEISNEHLKTYTPAQLSALLRQRTHLQKVLAAQSTARQLSSVQQLSILDPSSLSASSHTVLSSASANKPWIPETECQYVVCPRCRPSYRDKSFLSLNAIADNEFPLAAVVGFGFQSQSARPVAGLDLVKTIGLREIPTKKMFKLRRRGKVESLNGSSEKDQPGAELDDTKEQVSDPVEQTKRGSQLYAVDASSPLAYDPAILSLGGIARTTNGLCNMTKDNGSRIEFDESHHSFLSAQTSLKDNDTKHARSEPHLAATLTEPDSLDPDLSDTCIDSDSSSSSTFEAETFPRPSWLYQNPPTTTTHNVQSHQTTTHTTQDQASSTNSTGLISSWSSTSSEHDDVRIIPAPIADESDDTELTTKLNKVANKTSHLSNEEIPLTPSMYHAPTLLPNTNTAEHLAATSEFTPGPVSICEGVAVTEEGLELGIPDIITQIQEPQQDSSPVFI